MKNILAKLGLAIIIVSVFGSLLTGLGVLLFREYSVSPTFPYYYILLLNVRDAAYALWGYFDGVHYLRLIDYGYVDTGTQAFFPLYPMLSSIVKQLFGTTGYVSGLIVSYLSLIVATLSLWRLYPGRRLLATLTLFFFPTSFFLLGLYTESLFLALTLAFFVSLKKKSYFVAALFAGLASATRFVGILLSISLLLELYQNRSHLSKPKIALLLLLSVSGLLLYMLFLFRRFGDPLLFIHVQSMFGANRSGGEIILLPQVLYRYFRMILTVSTTTFVYQRIWLELIFFVAAAALWLKNYKTNPLSINVYVALSLLIPTLTGTLSSMPRYILVLVPFLLPQNPNRISFFILSTFNFLFLIYLFSHFAHGTFVA